MAYGGPVIPASFQRDSQRVNKATKALIEAKKDISKLIKMRYDFARETRKLANNVEEHVKNCGIAQTTSGGIGVASGAAIIGGILLAPFTAGWSTTLTIGGIAGSVASAGTTIGTTITKSNIVKNRINQFNASVKKMEPLEKKVVPVLKEFQDSINALAKYKNESWYKEAFDYGKTAFKSGMAVYKVYKAVTTYQAARFAMELAEFIGADFAATTGVAVGLASPGLRIFGETVVVAGSTTAKFLSSGLAVLGIGTGIWDIVSGVKDICGSKDAEEWRKLATKYQSDTYQMEQTMKKIGAL